VSPLDNLRLYETAEGTSCQDSVGELFNIRDRSAGADRFGATVEITKLLVSEYGL